MPEREEDAIPLTSPYLHIAARQEELDSNSLINKKIIQDYEKNQKHPSTPSPNGQSQFFK